jgi:hypothetical protein
MALKFIPQSWKDDMRENPFHENNFYINPRGRVFPAMAPAGVTFIKNDTTTNMRGTYRMQCGASTLLQYAYTLPQRFIIEGWFKPEFAYDVGANQAIFMDGSALGSAFFYLAYLQSIDKIALASSPPTSLLSSSQIMSTASLQKWIYIRGMFDNIGHRRGIYIVLDGAIIANNEENIASGAFNPANTISFFPGVAAESSYWIIHELDETLTTGQYKTYQADRQIIFDFNGTTLGRERIRIPRNSASTDLRGVRDWTINKTGSGMANTATLSLYNFKGQFSDDQYDAFNPFQGYYNGTQKYLQNRVGVEIDDVAPANTVRDGLEAHYSFDNSASPGIDNSGNGNTATISGATSCAGISGNGLSFDGINDVITIPSGLPAGDITISMWVYTTKIGGNRILLSQEGGAHRRLLIDNSNDIVFYSNRADGTTSVYTYIPSASWTASTWMHIVAIQSGLTIGIYLNGFLIDSDTSADIYTSFSANGYLGRDAVSNFFPGAMDEFRIYSRALSAGESAYLYGNPSDWGTIGKVEPLFIGRTTPGAFKRDSPSKFEGYVTIDAEDGISELGETKLPASHAYNNSVSAYKMAYPTDESLSLVHEITRLVTKHEIRNYSLNSSFENATIGNSWTASGLTLTRDNTYAQFGTYSAKAVAASAGQYFRQVIKFETADFIDVGDVFNFSAFIRQGTASTVKIQIEELDNSGTLIGSATETACGTDTGVFTRINVARTILSALCTELRITFYAIGASTFYADGVMLTRGIDPVDYFLLNAHDGTSGIGSAEDCEVYLYDTKAIDTEDVALSHPYAIVNKGDTAWDHLKDIGDALIPRYIGESCDGVLQVKFNYNETDPATIGAIENVASISTSLDINQANSIKVEGILIDKIPAAAVAAGASQVLWDGTSVFLTGSGNRLEHPIVNGAKLDSHGATVIEAQYSDTIKESGA